MKSEATGFRRLFHASVYSWQGIKSGWQSEAAIRQEIIGLMIFVPILCILDVTKAERAILFLSIILVFVVELLNTGIEVIVDRIGPDFHELSGKAKDLGSAAVLITIFAAITTWIIILW
jgi:diacylglycerol kinase (ATP)